MTTLDQEKFNTVKELAEISGNLSIARAELNNLKETTEEYMVVREKEAEERVIKILKESREALEEVSKNHQELTTYNGEIKAYAYSLKTIANEIIVLFEDFNARVKVADENIVKNQEIVNDVLTKMKIERVQIQEDRKLLLSEKKDLEDEFKLLKDKREALERAWAELERLKNNK